MLQKYPTEQGERERDKSLEPVTSARTFFQQTGESVVAEPKRKEREQRTQRRDKLT